MKGMHMTIQQLEGWPWVIFVTIGQRVWRVTNIGNPRFWPYLWTMYRGKRAWAIWSHVRHMIQGVN